LLNQGDAMTTFQNRLGTVVETARAAQDHEPPGRTAGTVEAKHVDFAAS
jgi:hypothetical protein